MRRQKTPNERIADIVETIKSPGVRFDWPEFLPVSSIAPRDVQYHEDLDRLIRGSLRMLPPKLRQHLLNVFKAKPDKWAGRSMNLSYQQITDPLYLELPPTITMFETGEPVLAVVRRYQELRRWRETLLKIARREWPLYLGERISGLDADGRPVYERDELALVLYALPRWDRIRECKECGSICLERRLRWGKLEIEPRCSARCGQKLKQRRSPRKPRPPSRLEDFRLQLKRYCRARNLVESSVENDEATIRNLADGMDFRPSTIRKCLEWIESEKKAGHESA